MAYQNPSNPDALPWFAEPEKKGGDKVTNSQPPPVQSGSYRSPPMQQQGFRPPPQQHQQPQQPQQPQYRQQQPQYQQHPQQHQQQQPPRRQPDPQYRQEGRPISPAQPPRDAYGGISGGDGSGGGRVASLTGGQRPSARMQPPRSPLSSPPPPSSTSKVVFQSDEELTTDQLRVIFDGLDTRRVGYITEKQLAENLVNSDRTKFDTYTVNMMVRMFDSDRSGDLDFKEFVGLWQFLDRWRTIFNRFDTDRSGNISMDEFKNTLVSFQYRLSDGFVEFLFKNYDRENRGVITFDLFMQSCITLKRMTDTFKKYDDDRDGYITINFEDFVSEFLRQIRRVMIVDDGRTQHPPGAY
ncbi:hypothetical protein SEPCBS57363_006721 [Sporothrix epigloea]|uniref:EF-hand domain-containing protein n=1 Tax=Sporothrix epigloea TaxID=1892477 RepID=A0ABP0E7S8_9PEZI